MFVAPAVDVVVLHHGALDGRKGVERRTQTCTKIVALGAVISELVCSDIITDGAGCAQGLIPPDVVRVMPHDLHEPSAKETRGRTLVEAKIRAGKRLLARILGVLHTRRQPARDRERITEMTVHQRCVSLRVAREGAGDQSLVRFDTGQRASAWIVVMRKGDCASIEIVNVTTPAFAARTANTIVVALASPTPASVIAPI